MEVRGVLSNARCISGLFQAHVEGTKVHLPGIVVLTCRERDTAPCANVHAFVRGQATAPDFIPLWSPCYDTTPCSLLFLHGKEGWTLGTLTTNILTMLQLVFILSDEKAALSTDSWQRLLAELQFHKSRPDNAGMGTLFGLPMWGKHATLLLSYF